MSTLIKQYPVTASRIANCKGIPGALGCLAYSLHTGQRVILSNWHIMFGKGAVKGDKIWLVETNGDKEKLHDIGRVINGRIGSIKFGSKNIYVDCAISSFTGERITGMPAPKAHANAQPGEQVYKYGPVTGFTTGTVVTTTYNDTALLDEQTYDAPGQLLIKSENGYPFSGAGDSGAVVLNADNKVIGLLWGTNKKGEGLACPIEPVVDVLNIAFAPAG